MKILSLLACIGLQAALGFLSVQSASAQREVVYRLAAFGTGKLPVAEVKNGLSSSQTVPVVKNFVANPVKAILRDDQFLDFFDKDATPAPDGEEQPKPLASLRVPAATAKGFVALLYFDGEGIQASLIPANSPQFKAGQTRVFNLLDKSIAFRFDTTREDGTVVQGKIIPIEAKGVKDLPVPRETASLRKIFYADKNGRAVTFSSTLYRVDARAKGLLFVYPNPGFAKPELASISIYDVNPELIKELENN